MESCKFYFHKRDVKKNPERLTFPIRLHFHYGGQPPFRYSTGEKWKDNPPSKAGKKKQEPYWDTTYCRPKGDSPEAKRLRAELQRLENAITAAYHKYRYEAANRQQSKEPTHAVLLELFLKELGLEPPKPKVVEKPLPTLAEAFTDFLAGYHRRSRKIYESTYTSLVKFVASAYAPATADTFPIGRLDAEFISRYKKFLYSPDGLDLVNVSANNYLLSFRTLFKELFGVGKKNKGHEKYLALNLNLDWLDYSKLPVLKANTKFYLTAKELYLLHHTYFWRITGQGRSTVFPEVILPVTHTCWPVPEKYIHLAQHKSLRRVVDLYLFCTEAPLRVSDIQKLEQANIVEMEDREGHKFKMIDMLQTKTQNPVQVALSERNLGIMANWEGYQQSPLPRKATYTIWANLRKALSLCPFLQYDVQYRAKKGDQVIIETKKKWEALSFHTSRNTFTTLGLNAGVPLNHLRGSMGHSSSTTTLLYDVSTQEDIAWSVRQFQQQLKDMDFK